MTNELARLIEVLQERADTAWNLRDDIYACPDGPEPRARIAINAFLHALDQERPQDDEELDTEAAQAILDRIQYRDWKFRLLELPDDTRCVRVTATVSNTYRDGKPFSITCRGWSGRTLLESAFHSVMAIEEHEARERVPLRR